METKEEYGIVNQSPEGTAEITHKILRLLCPYCHTKSKLTLVSKPDPGIVGPFKLSEVVAGYVCESCLRGIPIGWAVLGISNEVQVDNPRILLRSFIPFDFSHVPEPVCKDVQEALDCLSVNAHNGFAAMCRRTVQTICENMGTEGSTRVQSQIEELKDIAGLSEEDYETIKQIMLTGHDGAHPHLPPINQDRAGLLFQLLSDTVYQLYTRPGKIKSAAAKRAEAIADQKASEQPV